jgi:putative PIN family toxin of toxin-antitoxin system
LTIVLDSNVWISALKFGGTPLLALRKAYLRDRIACCSEIRTEVDRILVTRFGWKPGDPLLAMMEYSDAIIDVQITGALHGICRDPKDDMVFECATNSSAQAIVTCDHDLLAVGGLGDIQVLTVWDYLDPNH